MSCGGRGSVLNRLINRYIESFDPGLDQVLASLSNCGQYPMIVAGTGQVLGSRQVKKGNLEEKRDKLLARTHIRTHKCIFRVSNNNELFTGCAYSARNLPRELITNCRCK